MNIRTILNTRPISESINTTESFIKHGFEAVPFPCIEIASVNNQSECLSQINKIKSKSVIIFTSIQAVIHAFKIVPDWIISRNSVVLTVGSKTAQQLEKHINNKIHVPKLQNSDGIIAFLKDLSVLDSITLISAENGRQEIQNYANNNNITFSQINVYQRQLPTDNQAFDALIFGNDYCVLATSIVTLKNLYEMLDMRQWEDLKNRLIVCASARIERFAHEMGLKFTLNTCSANPEVMAEKLFLFISGLE